MSYYANGKQFLCTNLEFLELFQLFSFDLSRFIWFFVFETKFNVSWHSRNTAANVLTLKHIWREFLLSLSVVTVLFYMEFFENWFFFYFFIALNLSKHRVRVVSSQMEGAQQRLSRQMFFSISFSIRHWCFWSSLHRVTCCNLHFTAWTSLPELHRLNFNACTSVLPISNWIELLWLFCPLHVQILFSSYFVCAEK